MDPFIGGALLCLAYQCFTQSQVPAAPPAITAPAPPVKIKVEPAVKKQKGVDLVYATAFPIPTEEEVEEVEEEDPAKPIGKKRPRGACGADERNPNQFKAVGVHTIRKGLEVYNPPGDGNCWFGAVNVGMFSIGNPGIAWEKSDDEEYQLALELRVAIVQHMRENPDMYESVLVADGKNTAFKSMDEYCDKMSKPGEYADGSVMEAFCVLYKIKILLYMRVDQKVQKISDHHGESHENGTIKLYYTGGHYMCLHEF